MDYSELHVYSPNADQAYSLPRTVAWMNGERDAHMYLFRIGLSSFQPPGSTTATWTSSRHPMISLMVLNCYHIPHFHPRRRSPRHGKSLLLMWYRSPCH